MKSKFELIILIIFILYILHSIVIRIVKYFENKNLLKYNENDPEMKKSVEEAWREAEKILDEKGIEKTTGYCHRLWNLQKKILREKYRINWRTPAETDNVFYD